ncbi:MAG TPA: DUF3795 domain-containing protein [Petrotogaceae bacterium]|jgi:hypothetical protein|nr:DUF3795 domain-containing protein [Clostridia bacterium]HPO28062.1 DUF3795 domain-containing protein [Petrotogaceae bacterium]
MKMPSESIDSIMFAPCGMNCMVCYKHCSHKIPCAGCIEDSKGKPEHCSKCKIKMCVQEKGIHYCYECSQYPCKQMKYLENSYITRYGTSLIDNSRAVKEHGITAFMKHQKEKYTCPKCGGIISLHDSECSECKYQAKPKV